MDNSKEKVSLYNKIYLDNGQITIDGIPLKHIQRFEIKNAHWSEEPEVTIIIKANVIGLGSK